MRRLLRIPRVFLVILLSPFLALIFLTLKVGKVYRRFRERTSGWMSRGRTQRALAMVQERSGFDPLGEPLLWAYTMHFQYAPELQKLGRRLEEKGYTVLSIDMPETESGFKLRIGHHRHHTVASLLATLREVGSDAEKISASAESWDVAREDDAELWRVPGSYLDELVVTPHERTPGNGGRLPGLDVPCGYKKQRGAQGLKSGVELAEEVLDEMAAVHMHPHTYSAEPIWLHCYVRFIIMADAQAFKKELDTHDEARMEAIVEEVADKSFIVAASCHLKPLREDLVALGDWLTVEAATHRGIFEGWEINLKLAADSADIAFKKLMEQSGDKANADRELTAAEVLEAAAEVKRSMMLPHGPATVMNNLDCLGGPVLLMAGFTLLEKGHAREAAHMAHQLLELGMRYEGALHLLGHAATALKDHATAAGAFSQADSGEPENAGVQVNLGSALEALHRYGEAATRYRHALELQPMNPVAWLHLARVCAKLGHRNDTVNSVRHGMRQDAAQLANARADEDISHIVTAKDFQMLQAELEEWEARMKLQGTGKGTDALHLAPAPLP